MAFKVARATTTAATSNDSNIVISFAHAWPIMELGPRVGREGLLFRPPGGKIAAKRGGLLLLLDVSKKILSYGRRKGDDKGGGSLRPGDMKGDCLFHAPRTELAAQLHTLGHTRKMLLLT